MQWSRRVLKRRGRGGGRMRLCHVYACRSPRRAKRIKYYLVDGPLRVLMSVDSAFNCVAQLAHVSRPRISFELGHRARRETGPVGPIQFSGHAPSEVLGEKRHVALPRSQWRKRDHFERQTIEQVRAEVALV